MKKSLVAVSVIVAVGAAWTAASWYTGTMIEQRMDQLVEAANQQLNRAVPQYNLKLSYQDYQRGLFSSRVNFILQSETSGVADNKEDHILFIDTIDHGPFPLAQLKKLNLLPSLASVHTELGNSAPVKRLFEITNGQSPISADSRISYGGDSSSAISLLPIAYQKDDSSLKFSGASIDADIGKDMSSVTLKANSDSIELMGKNQWGQTEKFAFQGLTFDSANRLGRFELNIGDQKLNLKQLTINVDNKDALVMDGFQLTSSVTEDDKNLQAQAQYDLNALKIQGADFGSGKLGIKVTNLDGAATKAFFTLYQQQVMNMMHNAQTTPEQYESEVVKLLAQNLQMLLKGNPSIAVAPFSWKNSKGESTFNLTLDLQDAAISKAATADAILAQVIRQIDAKLVIPMPMANELMIQAATLQGHSAEEAEKLATQQVQGLAAMGQMFKLAQVKDDTISSSFQFANNQVDLNGQKMSLQEFVGMFGALGAPMMQGDDTEPEVILPEGAPAEAAPQP